MPQWEDLLQSIFIGLIFAYLLSKFISLIFSFKEGNLSITRESTDFEASKPGAASESDPQGHGDLGGALEADSMIGEVGSVRHEILPGTDDDEDWDNEESTELEEAFTAATMFVAETAADRASGKASTDVQLQLYGLYKIATEGPCTSPQPSALKMAARAKWQAWHKLGDMVPEEAMLSYLDILTEHFPTWAGAAAAPGKGGAGNASNKDGSGPMGPVFSSFIYEEESGNELTMDAIHAFAREGELGNLIKCVESGVSVDLKDSEGRTPLHWAVDRGHINMTEMLVSRNADVNAKDNEGQTPLHYAATCEREDIAKYLVKHSADRDMKDIDGNSPLDLTEKIWPWLRHVYKTE